MREVKDGYWDRWREQFSQCFYGLKFNKNSKDPISELNINVSHIARAFIFDVRDEIPNVASYMLKYYKFCDTADLTLFGNVRTSMEFALHDYYYNAYFVHWYLQDGKEKEYLEKFSQCVRYNDLFNEPIIKKDDRGLKELLIGMINWMCTLAGEFDLVKETIEKVFQKEDYTAGDNVEDIIRYGYRFYYVFAKWMLEGKKKERRPFIEEMFQMYFREYRKDDLIQETYGNFHCQYMVWHIYYKYILEMPDEEITPYRVYRSAELGLCFWKNKDIEYEEWGLEKYKDALEKK